MKIIKNDRRSKRNSDVLIAENVNDRYSKYLVDCLSKNNFTDDFILVPDEYILFVKEEKKLELKDFKNYEILEEFLKRFVNK